jgi:hypothetical protein
MLRAVVAAFTAALAVPAVAGAISFQKPVPVSRDRAYQAGEPSIRVDANDPTQRIWIAAPSGIGVNSRSLPEGQEAGDLFWYSDDNGKTWTFDSGPGGVGSPTMIGGGDSDVATGFGDQVFGTGLTLANITLAASCDNGGTFTFNPLSNIGTVEDRQWIDAYEDHPKPLAAPDLVLAFGQAGAGRMEFNQVYSPGCGPPWGGASLDVSAADCTTGLTDSNCYQWPGNVAIDENTGDAYVTHNTLGTSDTSNDDKVIVTRVDGGAERPALQTDVHPYVAAANRPDTFDSFTVVAVDRARHVIGVWSERHHDINETWTMLAVSRDHGVSWSTPIKVNSSPKTTTYPWIVAGDAGKIDIVYYGTAAKGFSPETVGPKSTWRVYMAQSLNALSAKPAFTETVASPVIQQGSICTSGTGCAAGTRDLLDFFQIDVDAQGLANIAYTDNYNTPPDGSDPHQEWVTFVQQKDGTTLFAR